MYNFTIRIFKDKVNNPQLSQIDFIEISGVTLISKKSKIDGLCMHLGNQKKYGYKISISKKFNRISGSHSYPSLTFKGEYIDIVVKNFPRYPAFYQDKYAARNCLNGWGYTNYLNKGFPHQLLYRKIEIIL